jgi:hypothetical protein
VLQRHPLLYAFVGGVGVILFWRGVWHLMDFFALVFLSSNDRMTTIDWSSGVDSCVSLVLGAFLLLSTGLFVSEFLSGHVLMKDVKKEEELTKKTEEGVEKESSELPFIEKDLRHIEAEIKDLEDHVRPK